MNVGRKRLWMCLVVSLILGAFEAGSADAGLFGLWRPKKKVVKPQKVSLVVFPFDQGPDVKSPLADDYGGFIASDLRTMLAGSDRYSVFLYKDRLAPIERAKTDNVLKSADLAPPFAEDRAKSLKLARILATDYYLVGEIDDLQVDRASKVAEITLKADLYDGKTGKLMKTFLVTGRTPDAATTS